MSTGGTPIATYLYDADGRRVHRTGYTRDTCDATGQRNYVFDLSGNAIVENNSNGTGCVSEIFVDSRHLLTNRTSAIFDHTDWLGTARLRNSYTSPGSGFETCTSLPFGDALSCSSSDLSTLHFTGKERDAESGLDYFGARYNSASMGRFLRPDPDNISGLLNQDDPQAWNGYAYARNNPLRYTDADGENYSVCDNQGQNCANLTDDQYSQYLSSLQGKNLSVTPSGLIQVQNDNGSFTTIGQATHFNENDAQAAGRISQFAGPIEALGLAEFIVLGPYAGPALLGTAPEVGLTGIGLGAGVLGAGNAGGNGPNGPSSDYIDITKPGSKPPNKLTNVTAKEFGDNLEAQGYSKSQKGDVTTYTKGDTRYTVYPKADSTGRPTAQVSINGTTTAKIRLLQ